MRCEDLEAGLSISGRLIRLKVIQSRDARDDHLNKYLADPEGLQLAGHAVDTFAAHLDRVCSDYHCTN